MLTPFHRHKQSGITLLTLLLLMAIMGGTLFFALSKMNTQKAEEIRYTRTILQMSQILNGALAYYIKNGRWPDSIDQLRGIYLPSPGVVFNNGWGNPFFIKKTSRLLYVYTDVLNPAQAAMVAGKLPQSFISTAAGVSQNPPTPGLCSRSEIPAKDCQFAVASVNSPGQNLNNATAINYMNIYHNGACVPAPECPVDANGVAMKPEIMVIPVAVSGVRNRPDSTKGADCKLVAGGYYECANLEAYPMNSFTARAIGAADGSPVDLGAAGKIQDCDPSAPAPAKQVCYKDMVPRTDMANWPKITSGKYWRVCVATNTSEGSVQPSYLPVGAGVFSSAWGVAAGAVIAITHCVVNNEPRGSGFFVWGE